MHIVARCNNREFALATAEDCAVVITHLHEMARTYDLTLYAYTVMSNHLHLLLRAPTRDALGRPLRWFMTETAKAFHRARGRTGHFWERRYLACLVEDDLYALAALRYVDRNPVRAGLVADPATYPWSSCAAYAHGTPNPLITLHPSYLALSPYPKVRQRHYQALLAPTADPVADGRDPRWTTHRAVGSPAFLARHARRRPGRPKVAEPPRNTNQVRLNWCPVPVSRWIAKAAEAPCRREATRPTAAAKQRRLDNKQHRSVTKRRRHRVSAE